MMNKQAYFLAKKKLDKAEFRKKWLINIWLLFFLAFAIIVCIIGTSTPSFIFTVLFTIITLIIDFVASHYVEKARKEVLKTIEEDDNN